MPVSLHRFKPRSLQALKGYTKAQCFADIGAGMAVGVVALPLAMAFAIASGLKPEQGLAAAIIGGLLISALGGSSVQIGGPAGAFIVVVYGIVAAHGVAGLMMATLMAGALMTVLGLLKCGAWIRLFPPSLIMGFTNGIAVLIAVSQLKDLLGLELPKMPAYFLPQISTLWAALPQAHAASWLMGAITFAGMLLWSRLWADQGLLPQTLVEGRTARTVARIPGAIVALLTTSVATALWHLPVQTVGTRFGGIPQGLPWPSGIHLGETHLSALILPALTLAALGAIESLLCARVADALIDKAPHDSDQELMAQGIANMVVPWFGAMPVTGTIARTVTNVRSGAQTPMAGVVHAATLLLIVLVAGPWCLHIPLPALAGILLFVAWNMGEWHAFTRLYRQQPFQRLLMFTTFALTVLLDLTVALSVGLILAWLGHKRAAPAQP